MNKTKKSGPLQSFIDSIYVESIRRGAGVTLLVMAVISGGLTYMIYAFLLYGYVESNADYKEQVTKKEGEIKKTEVMLAGETQFRAEFKKVADLFDEAKPLLPQEAEISDVLAQVDASAKRNNVVLTGLQAVNPAVKSQSQNTNKLYERAIPATVTGAYPKVVSFFADISRMPRILLVRDYSVASLKSSVTTGFTLLAYHAPPPTEIPPVPKDIASLGGDQK